MNIKYDAIWAFWGEQSGFSIPTVRQVHCQKSSSDKHWKSMVPSLFVNKLLIIFMQRPPV